MDLPRELKNKGDRYLFGSAGLCFESEKMLVPFCTPRREEARGKGRRPRMKLPPLWSTVVREVNGNVSFTRVGLLFTLLNVNVLLDFSFWLQRPILTVPETFVAGARPRRPQVGAVQARERRTGG